MVHQIVGVSFAWSRKCRKHMTSGAEKDMKWEGVWAVFVEETSKHEPLFSGSSLELGRIHWYILKADFEMEKRSIIRKEDDSFFSTDETTPFGEEIGTDEIHWWVFRKEPNLEELREKTDSVLECVQKLKEDSFSMKNSLFPKSYSDLLEKIKEFTEQDSKEIHSLHQYVMWLNSRDILAPAILFTYRVWGSTRLSDRMMPIGADSIDHDQKTLEKCVEVALGLRERVGYTIDSVHSDMAADIYDSVFNSADAKAQWPVGDPVPKEKLITRCSNKVLDELAAYFEFIRNSLRNILIEIDRYKEQFRLVHNESFLTEFVKKAMADNRVETQLWDFKSTLEMWHCPTQVKEGFEIDFAEQVSSYANSDGGVLIIGITNVFPRKIVGVTDLENKIKSAKSVLDKYTDNSVPTHFQQIRLKDESDKEYDCLIIAIAQTTKIVKVRDEQGKFSYPIRQGTGKGRSTPELILPSKANVLYDNYNFVSSLDAFVNGK